MGTAHAVLIGGGVATLAGFGWVLSASAHRADAAKTRLVGLMRLRAEREAARGRPLPGPRPASR